MNVYICPLSGGKRNDFPETNSCGNPAVGSFTLVLPTMLSNISVSIYNSKGSLMKQQICKGGNTQFNTEKWSSGEYVVKISNGKGETITKKLVINK